MHDDLLQPVEARVLARDRGALRQGLECDDAPRRTGQSPRQECEEPEVRTDVEDDRAAPDVPTQSLLHARLERAAHQPVSLHVREGQSRAEP
ncbi:MAG TPA: hypothetical protein VF549_04730 [Solirubrobacteraceae bacterium]